jgi:hypothetical protein
MAKKLEPLTIGEMVKLLTQKATGSKLGWDTVVVGSFSGMEYFSFNDVLLEEDRDGALAVLSAYTPSHQAGEKIPRNAYYQK